jgi:hypothetical protein
VQLVEHVRDCNCGLEVSYEVERCGELTTHGGVSDAARFIGKKALLSARLRFEKLSCLSGRAYLWGWGEQYEG